MALTVTVRFSVLVALFLVVTGSGLYVVSGQDADPAPETRIEVSQVHEIQPRGENFSTLSHEQRAVFLLAVDPDERGSYATNDTELAAAIDSIPDRVRYDGDVYEVSRPRIGGDSLPSAPAGRAVGIGLAGLGVVVLAVAELRRLRRRSRRSRR